MSAWTAPMSACITAMDSLLSAFIASIDFLVSAWAAPMSACIAPIRSKSKSTAEPGRERRDEEVDQFDTLEERPDLVSILCFIIIQEFQSITNQTRSSNNSN